MHTQQTIGIIGAGSIGSTLARALTAHGYPVVLSNSRGPESLAELVAELGPLAKAATAAEAAAAGELVVVTIPLGRIGELAGLAGLVADKTVIDTNNYYPERDGLIDALEDESTTTAELLQGLLPAARVVKAFNHINAAKILEHASPAGSPNRRALAIAGDDDAAKEQVAALIDALGFDAVDLGPLAEGWRIQRDTPGYGPRRTAEQLRGDLAAATRYRDR